ncbi:MAG: M1 family metallopeptidase [Phycisphaerales bacterium]|jgi:hypothetical protein|nr:M1 family metallopeptidase [Phycisphaerales bacterium]
MLLALSLTAVVSAHPNDRPWRPERLLPREDPFARLDDAELPSPNRFRAASGAPGPDYWQQQVDYEIAVRLDPVAHTLDGHEHITYHNNSPDTLHWLWVQLDQNRFRPDARGQLATTAPNLEHGMSFDGLRRHLGRAEFHGGMHINRIADDRGNPLPFVIDGTMMRIDLPTPLNPGETQRFEIDWTGAIVPDEIAGRSGYETFDDGRTLYQIAQWFPRLAAYTDYDGWQTRPFLGRGEFTLEFGDYNVSITVPDTFLVGATGELTNPRDVLEPAQRNRLAEARASDTPIMIVTREESDDLVAAAPTGENTWNFEATNVRDFAFSTSPAFAWDAMGVQIPGGSGETVMAMSMWPKEADGLWDKYSTHAVAHALESYSRTAMPYPWPVAWSVNGLVGGGMEYPMMTFNGPRPEDDGTWTERAKYGLISVVIHEVGHFWFPMIVNSDERQWTWMDEGLNSYHQFLAERSWEEDYSRSRALPRSIAGYMSDVEHTRPIMTASEDLLQFGNNAYAKPATALNILRETVVGRDLFDHAMHAYTQRWAFKRPEPADFFRTIEDASGRDLDWFWRGWFYDTRPVDMGVEDVQTWRVSSGEPAISKAADKAEQDRDEPTTVTELRNTETSRRVDRFPDLIDFYSTFESHDVTPADERSWQKLLGELDEDDRSLLETDALFHIIRFNSNGGLVMPLPLRLVYEDGTIEDIMLPADLWRSDHRRAAKMLIRDKAIDHVLLDPNDELADVDRSDNRYPPKIEGSRFGLNPERKKSNPMRDAANEAKRTQTAKSMSAWATSTAARLADTDDHIAALFAAPAPSDGWGNPIGITVLDLDPADGIARLISPGPDGLHGTPDDLSTTLTPDGTLTPLLTAPERPE